MPILIHSFEFGVGPTIELYVGRPSGEAEVRSPCLPICIRALVDTGAGRTVLERWVFDQLELYPVGQMLVHTASTGRDPVLADRYAVDISLGGEETGLLAVDLEVFAVEDLSGSRVQSLLSRDILRQGLLIYDGPHEHFTLAIEPPQNPAGRFA